MGLALPIVALGFAFKHHSSYRIERAGVCLDADGYFPGYFVVFVASGNLLEQHCNPDFRDLFYAFTTQD